MPASSESIDKRIRIIIEGVGIMDTSNAIEALSRSVGGVDTTRLTSMTNEIKSLGMAVNGKYDFKSFSSNISELMALVRGLPTDFTGFTSMANALTPLVTAMQTISGSRFSIGTLREEITKLIDLSKMDFSRLNAMSGSLRSFSARVSGIVMPIINADSIISSVNKLANVAMLPIDKLIPMGNAIAQFSGTMSTITVNATMGESLKSIAQGIHALASASAKDTSGLMTLPLHIANLAKGLIYLSRVPDLSQIVVSLRAIGASIGGLSGGAMTIGNIEKNLSSLSAAISKVPATGIKITVDPMTFTDLERLNILLQSIASSMAKIPTRTFKVNVPPSSSGTGLTQNGGVLNKKTWVDTSGAIHGTNRALHFFRTALTTIGFTYFMSLVREAIDEFTELRSRILLTAHTIGNYHEALKGVFNISNDVRASVGAMSKLFNKFQISLEPFGATVKQTTAFVKSLAQTIKISGSNTAEQKAFYVQFGQAIQSGVLRGREFRSMLESNLYMSRLLAKELAQGDLGKLKEMAFKGQLDALTVTNAILKNQGKINKNFERVTITISDMYELIKNKLIETMMKWDYVIGQSRIFKDILGWIKDNLDNIIVAITAFVATTMVQLLFQFGLMAKIIKSLSVAGIIFALKELYENSKRFRDYIKQSVQYFKNLFVTIKESSSGILGLFNKIISKVGEFYESTVGAGWEASFLELERRLLKIMVLLDALSSWDSNRFGANYNDALIAMRDELAKGLSAGVGILGDLTGMDALSQAGWGGLDERVNYIKSYNQEFNSAMNDLEDTMEKHEVWSRAYSTGLLKKGVIEEKLSGEGKEYAKKEADRLNYVIDSYTRDILQSIDKMSEQIYSADWVQYDRLKKSFEGGGQSAKDMMEVLDSPINIIQKSLTKYYQLTGELESVGSSVASKMEELRNKTSNIITKPIIAEDDKYFNKIEKEWKNVDKYIDERLAQIKKKSTGVAKSVEEAVKPIQQETLLTGLFTKYFKATTFTTDLTWTPDLTIKPKKVVVQDWILTDSFKNSLAKAEDPTKKIIGDYFDELKTYWEIKEKETALMSKYPETAKLSQVSPKLNAELNSSTIAVLNLEKNLIDSGIKLEDYYDRLYKVVALVKPQDTDFLKASGMSEAEYMLSSMVDLSKQYGVNISDIISKLETAFANENMFKSFRELVASGASIEIEKDFYGKVGDIGDIMPKDYDKLKTDFPDIFSRAYENADQLKDVITQIINLYKYEDYQSMTTADKFGEGILSGFQQLYDEYNDIIGQINGLTTQIFNDFAEEANKYFLGLTNDWRAFAQNALKAISDATFKMLLFGNEGLLNALSKKMASIDLVRKPETSIADLEKDIASASFNKVAVSSNLASSATTTFATQTFNATASLFGFQSAVMSATLALASMSASSGAGTVGGSSGLFSGFSRFLSPVGGNQLGGSNKSGEATWVGERGRELFVPDTSGHTYSNNSSEAKAKDGKSESSGVTIVNLKSKAELMSFLNSPEGKKAIVNTMTSQMIKAGKR